jgi:UTP--glucose-1-phosphate uridylyltransferase
VTSIVRKAIFPVAGLGTRFLPATKAQPKEMLPLVDKPIIQYGVEEAVASGIDNIILVTGRGKNAIEDHFDVSVELESFLEARGKRDQLDEIRKISNMINFCMSGRESLWASATPCSSGGILSATSHSR